MTDSVTTPTFTITAAPSAKINHSIVHDVVILMSDEEQKALKEFITSAPENAVFVE